jgi:hypothetical protein
MAADATTSLENGLLSIVRDESDMKQEADVLAGDVSQYPLDALNEVNGAVSDAMDIDSQLLPDSPSAEKKPTKPRKRRDTDNANKSTVHSSKNEGQHTDKRYLCYVCDKLFTRRRSVRDHMAKIHGSKAFEPLRSLEVTVDPVTGEPTEPLEDIIARGPPPPPEKPAKVKKDKPKPADEPAQPDDPAEPVAGPVLDPVQDLGDFPLPELDALPAKSATETKREITPVVETVQDAKPSEPSPPPPALAAPPASLIGKKRPASEISKPLPAAVSKKGTARKPAGPVTKKPRLTEHDSASDRSTPVRSPSATPVTAMRTIPSKLKKQLSAASSPASSRAASMDPASPSPSAAETPGSSNDDGEVFCICRKGDNHTWMIACDGGCDEWYHGKCVNIRERDGDLIDKYICPECTRSDLQTTWKRMCRRQDCRKPAKVFQDPPSKYCSKECGRMFFVELLRRSDPYIETIRHDQYVVDGTRPRKLRKKRGVNRPKKRYGQPLNAALHVGATGDNESRLATPAHSEDEQSEYETDSSADEDQLTNRGVSLRAGEVKAITEQCKTIEEWRALGRKPATPPPDADDTKSTMIFDDFEKNKLLELEVQKVENQRHLTILEAKEKLLEAIKTRSTGITDEVKKSNPKWKEICGFDPRLAWNEDMFIHWYDNKGGKQILESEKPRIGQPEDIAAPQSNGDKLVNGFHHAGSDDEGQEDGKPTKKGGVCIRNRCSRHRNWAKAQLAEIRFEQDFVKRNVRKTEELEKGLKDRAVLRALESR